MDDQSFRLLMSKLESLEDGQTRMYLHFNQRMDEHNAIFAEHIKDDKRMVDKLEEIGKEVAFAKGVSYVIGGGTALTGWVSGWFK